MKVELDDVIRVVTSAANAARTEHAVVPEQADFEARVEKLHRFDEDRELHGRVLAALHRAFVDPTPAA